MDYDIDELAAFAHAHLAGKEVYVTFYGGEPTLNRPMMLEVMERFPHWRFQLQTNGTLLDDLPWVLERCPTCWCRSTAARPPPTATAAAASTARC
jgi:uncharacterized protein